MCRECQSSCGCGKPQVRCGSNQSISVAGAVRFDGSGGVRGPQITVQAPQVDLGQVQVQLPQPTVRFGAPTLHLGAPEIRFNGVHMELGEPDIELGTPTITLGHPVVRMAGGQSAVGYSSSPAISMPAPRVILGDAKIEMGSGGTSAPGVTSRGYTGCSRCGCGCSGGMSTSESYSPGGRRHYTPAGVYGGGTLAEGTGEFETSSRRVFSRYIDAGCGQLRDRSRYDTRTGAAPVTAAGALQYSEAKEDAGASGGGRKRIVSARKLQEMKRVHGYTFQ